MKQMRRKVYLVWGMEKGVLSCIRLDTAYRLAPVFNGRAGWQPQDQAIGTDEHMAIQTEWIAFDSAAWVEQAIGRICRKYDWAITEAEAGCLF